MGPEDLVAFGIPEDAPTTVKRLYYAHALKVAPGIKEQTSTSSQTAVRYTATHSDRPALSHLIWLSHGLFLVGKKYAGTGAVRVKNELSALVSAANGGAPVYALPLTNMFNSDATTLYVYSDSAKRGSTEHWCRLGPANRDTRGHASIKGAAGTNRLNLDGIRISVSCLGNMAGNFAPVIVTVSGFAPSNLRVPMRRFKLEGGDYLVLLRAKGDDERTAAGEHWKAIDKEVHIPWMREQMTAAGYPLGHPLHHAFQTFDGCGAELAAFTDPTVLEHCEETGIRRGKGHRSRTGCEQVFDLSEGFKGMHREEKHRKVETDAERRVSARVKQTLRNDPDVELGLKLGPVADFCATLPRWKQLHLHGPDLVSASSKAGWTQSPDKPYPNLLGPLETSMLPVNQAVVAALRDQASFSKLYWGMAVNATIVEAHLDELGIPFDVKPDGTNYIRDEVALPLQNKRHALLSNGKIATDLRAATAAATTSALTATAAEITIVKRKLHESKECESQVVALSGTSLAASGLPHFGTPGNTAKLKAFYHVRQRTTSASKGLVFPNRGKVAVDPQAAAAEEAAAVSKMLRDSEDCVNQVTAKSGTSLELSSVDAFATTGNTRLLRAFHHARKRSGITADGLDVPNRGKLSDAKTTPPSRNLLYLCWEARNDPVLLLPPAPLASTPPTTVAGADQAEKNLMELCWEVRNDPVIMLVPLPYVPPALPEGARLPTPEATMMALRVEYNAPGPAEVLIGDAGKRWVLLAQTEMHCVVERDASDVSIGRATRSHEVALARLPNHVTRVKVAAKRDLNFWVWKWVLLNIGRGCAALECTKALYDDFDALPWDGCFVASAPGSMLTVAGSARKLVGAYAARHAPSSTIVRIGMAAGQGAEPMYNRWFKEHLARAALKHSADASNLFYKSYCSKLAAEPTQPPIRIGWFEDLEPVVFFGIKPDATSAFIGRSDNDLLLWPDWFIAELDKTMSHLPDRESKQLRCVCYLFELIGDLLIAPTDNVSEAPGVEQLLRQYGSGN